MAAVRSAEKDRVSTCAFADRVAACVLAAYRLHGAAYDAERRSAGRQTVVAGICALDSSVVPPALACVSWGCGTKFMRRELVDADEPGTRVRDSHAEVLARRALLHALYAELDEATGTPAPPADDQAQHARTAPVDTGAEEGAPPAEALASQRVHLLERIEPAPDGNAPTWRLRAGVTLHFYSSSQPCGNASIKRWAKGRAEVRHAQLSELEWPAELASHARQHWAQQREGQVARLVKKEDEGRAEAAHVQADSGDEQTEAGLAAGAPRGARASGEAAAMAREADAGANGGAAGASSRMGAPDRAHAGAAGGRDSSREEARGTPAVRPNGSGDALGDGGAASDRPQLPNTRLRAPPQPSHPPGTAPAGSGVGRTHTCSDKMCRWQCLGLQGGLLAHLIPAPLAVRTVTVGRKFHRLCLERAICCRAQDFETLADAPPASKRARRGRARLLPPVGYRVHHAAVLCTSTKLDPNTPISTVAAGAQHASFSDPRALWWAAGERGCEVLDGETGLPFAQRDASPGGAAISRISSRALYSRFAALCTRSGRAELVADRGAPPWRAKQACAAYAQAREALLTDSCHLGGWQVKPWCAPAGSAER
ncbi:hypothetical protein KFE25_013792 [Diacronema lutheri]|uniref:A to I editase domain-containing protein n=1 Tax=Diacronema lutheri TaxID=2081491 RepID=A0A8J5XZA4_DIALT|nr:hypothetical protein KFE25_013792 [Diacronema lutheri]